MSAFEQSQQAYFTKELNRAIPSQAEARTLDLAIGTDTKGFLSDFGSRSGATKRDAECRAIPYPGPAMRKPDARTGCGWWYSPDPTMPSTGAYGARRGPMDPTLAPGKWIWNPKEAAKLEGQKVSARIKTCPDIQFSPNPNIGWCPSTGRALVTDGRGNPAYPQTTGGDCPGGGIIMAAANCPKDPVAGPNTSVTGICTPVNGALAPACLQALSTWECSPNGLLPESLANGYAGTSDAFNATNSYLLQRGFTLHSGILRDGRLSVQDALSSVKGLRSMANSGDGSRATEAAKNLCFGTPFNPCSFKESDRGPFDATCIAQKAYSMGYSPNGTLLPSKIGMGYWNETRTWKEVIDRLTWWKLVADMGPSFAGQNITPQLQQLQVAAISHVYGISMNIPKPVCSA